MTTTHTIPNSTRRFNRHNLPPNTAGALVVVNDCQEILAVVSSAARFTTDFNSADKFDQLFICQHENDADVPAKCVNSPITPDQHRTTIVFKENAFTDKIGKLKPGRCWASISIRGLSPTRHSPEVVWEPLDEATWKPSLAMTSKFPLPGLGDVWPMDGQITDYAAVNPEAWHLLITAASTMLGIPILSFPRVNTPAAPEMKFMQERDAALRAERDVSYKVAREQSRLQNLLAALPPDKKAAYLKRLTELAAQAD